MPYDSHSITLPSDLFSLALHPTRSLLAAGLSSGHLHTYTWPYSEDSGDDDGDDEDVGKTEENGGFKILWKTRRHKGSCRCVAFSGDGDGGVYSSRRCKGRVLTFPAFSSGLLVWNRLAVQSGVLGNGPGLCEDIHSRSRLVTPPETLL